MQTTATIENVPLGNQDPPAKNSVWNLFGSTHSCTEVIWSQVPETQQQTCSYSSFTASGVVCWLSKDPIGISGGLNQYVAFGNNPVMFRDPDGLKIKKRPMSPQDSKAYDDALSKIRETPVGAQMLDRLEASKHTYYLIIGDNDGPWPTGQKDYDCGGGEIIWDTDDKFYGLAHEIGHAWATDMGLEALRPKEYDIVPGTTPAWEEYSMAIEEIVRRHHGVKSRGTYWKK